MNRVVRKSAFETNSSSCHSIVIDRGEFVADKMPLEDDVCKVHGGEFGWEIEDYNDAPSKASYALTWAKGKEGTDNRKAEGMLREVLLEETGAREVEFCEDSGYFPWGYIDHQSDEIAAEAFRDKDSLRAFIFNPRSTLHTDNDNH